MNPQTRDYCVVSVRDSSKSMKETSQEASTHSGKSQVAEKNHLADQVEKKDDGARTGKTTRHKISSWFGNLWILQLLFLPRSETTVVTLPPSLERKHHFPSSGDRSSYKTKSNQIALKHTQKLVMTLKTDLLYYSREVMKVRIQELVEDGTILESLKELLSATEMSEEKVAAIFTTIADLFLESSNIDVKIKLMIGALVRSLQALLADPREEKEGVSQTEMETSFEEIMFSSLMSMESSTSFDQVRTEMPKTKQEAVTNKVFRLFDNPGFDTMLVSLMVGDYATIYGIYQMDKGKSELALPVLPLIIMLSAGSSLKLLYFLLNYKFPRTAKFFATLGLTSSIGGFLSMAAAMCPRSMLSFFIGQGTMIVAALVMNLI